MKKFFKHLSLSTAALLMLAATPANLTAGLVTYTESVTGSGSLDGRSFTNALIKITYVGNSADIVSSGGVSILGGGTATVDVAGIGSDTFAAADRIQVFADSTSTPASAGIRSASASAIVLATFDASFNNYALTAPFGPVTGIAFAKADVDSTTSGGTFTITSTTGRSTFTAVPEPSSLILAGTGLLGLAASQFARRRRPV